MSTTKKLGGRVRWGMTKRDTPCGNRSCGKTIPPNTKVLIEEEKLHPAAAGTKPGVTYFCDHNCREESHDWVAPGSWKKPDRTA